VKPAVEPMVKPRISVIIPTYNHSGYLLTSLESVLHQTYTDFEIIVVNDGSTDQTASVLEPYIQKGLIHYFYQENKGQATARNLGLRHARGEYIACIDDDDECPPDKLELQLKWIESKPCAAVGGWSGRIINGAKISCVVSGGAQSFGLDDFFNGNPFSSPGQMLIPAKYIRAVNGFDPQIWGADDLDLYMRISQFGEIIRYPETTLFYRVHDQNSSRQTLRMLQNTCKVICKNSGAGGRSKTTIYKQNGYRFLFNYLGTQVIQESKQYFKQFKILKFMNNSRIFTACFFIPALKDVSLARTILLHWCPVSIKNLLSQQ
jgi:glycosyltransferase involved in cell wall biosynthesis